LPPVCEPALNLEPVSEKRYRRGGCPYNIDDKVEHLVEKIELMKDGIEEVKEHQRNCTEHMEDIKKNIKEIHETILNPEQGLYTRLKTVESWRSTISKIVWLVLTSSIGIIITKMFILK